MFGSDWPVCLLVAGYRGRSRRAAPGVAAPAGGRPGRDLRRHGHTGLSPHRPIGRVDMNENGRGAFYVGDRRFVVTESPPVPPGAERGTYRRRLHRDLRHRPAHPARRHGRPGDRPAVLGHEMSGRVAEVGDARDRLGSRRPGDRDAARLVRQLPGLPAPGTRTSATDLNFIGIDSPGCHAGVLDGAGAPSRPAPGGAAAATTRALVEPTAVAVHDVRRSPTAGRASTQSWSAAGPSGS